MNKKLMALLGIATCCLLTGCSEDSEKTNSNIQENCKEVINISNDFFNKYKPADDIGAKILEVYKKCELNATTSNETFVCTNILSFAIEFTSYTSNKSSVAELQEIQNEIKENCL